jgi:UDP-N-acetylmuramate--alanine ligase
MGNYYFDFRNGDVVISDILLGIAGLHNVENAVAAIEVCLRLGVSPDAVKSALASFRGVKRRFEYIVKTPGHIYIDDYAHHPEELRAAISSVKKLYPDKKLTIIFQPHLFTRTRDFADGFAEVLDMSDELLMLDIYPARELPIDGIDSELILSKMKLWNKRKCGKQEAVEIVESEKPELLLTVGAGDIDQLVQPLKQVLKMSRKNYMEPHVYWFCLVNLPGRTGCAHEFYRDKKSQVICTAVKYTYRATSILLTAGSR